MYTFGERVPAISDGQMLDQKTEGGRFFEEKGPHINQMASNSGESGEFYNKSHPESYEPLTVDYFLDFHRGSHKFTLNTVNKVFLRRDKSYNLFDKLEPRRRLRCGCVKSNCEAKYCECFRAGETCGEDCGCVDCHNTRKHGKVASGPLEVPTGCKCLRSGCLKKYCECFQRGEKCGPHCQCFGCQNCEESSRERGESE